MEKKPQTSIGYIGHVDHGKSALHHAIAKVLAEERVVIVSNPVKEYDLEINGIKYIEREPKKSSNGMDRIAAILAVTGAIHGLNSGYERQRPNVNIIEEFKLIQDKKSKLCRNDREWVQWKFNKLFKALTNS